MTEPALPSEVGLRFRVWRETGVRHPALHVVHEVATVAPFGERLRPVEADLGKQRVVMSMPSQ